MATLVRFEPVRELAMLQSEISRFTNGILEGNGRSSQAWVPALDAWETDDSLVYAFDLPGVPEDGISIELDDGALTVTAERERTVQVEKERLHRFERRFGTFTRAVGVPQGVNQQDVTASYADCVLELRVRKPEQPKPRKIELAMSAIGGRATQA